MTTTDCVNMYKIMHLYRPETLTSSSSLQKEKRKKTNQKPKQTQTQKNKPKKPTECQGVQRLKRNSANCM